MLYGKSGVVDKIDDILPDTSKKSTIAERIEKGEISTKLNKWKQRKHIEGTNEFRTYKEGRNKKGHTYQSILTIDDNQTQKLINIFSGKGEPKKVKNNTSVNVEYVDADVVVGKYYSNGQYHDTKRFAIHYGKDGAHIIPVDPKGVFDDE
ncbi:MAG: hypothetical protein IJO22_06110 [Oscillospiraceae bacterium]|nr:hypothetical protein [Oscillospiraceae bacterium]